MAARTTLLRAGTPADTMQDNLGPLAELSGSWRGKGFNLVSLPDKQDSKPFRLMLNATMETLAFTPISGKIPNRGSLQGDIFLFGLSYMQQVSDAVTNEGIHFEPGLWRLACRPQRTRLLRRLWHAWGTIPHGDALLAQGDFFTVNGPPQIDPVDSTPFKLDAKTGARNNETDAIYLAPFTSSRLPAGIPKGAIANPNVVLTNAITSQKIVSTVVLRVNAAAVGGINGTPIVPPNSPSTVGNIGNVPFVAANANAGSFSAIFWIEIVQNPDGSQFMQLQYTQTVVFDFLNVKWPHISVATLIKQ